MATLNDSNNTKLPLFWATVCKTVRPMLPVRCLSVCLSVCDVGVFWPNGWMDEDETWHGGRPRPRSHCVRWGPSSFLPKGAQPPNFRPMSIVTKRLPISANAEHLLGLWISRICDTGIWRVTNWFIIHISGTAKAGLFSLHIQVSHIN